MHVQHESRAGSTETGTDPVQAPVALVTGAARRVGRAIVETLHAEGWRVIVHCRGSRTAANAVVAELEARRPGTARVVVADLADPATIEGLAEQTLAAFGRLDLLVNNASSYARTPFGSIRASDVDDLVATNLRAPLLLSQALAPRIADGGSIINIIDIYARKPIVGYAPYLAAKAGLWAITEALALELAPRLRVNGIAPGHLIWADGGQIPDAMREAELAKLPLGRLGGAESVAAAVRYLASDAASYLTGAILPVDGGLRLT